jgi:hypothetical protein
MDSFGSRKVYQDRMTDFFQYARNDNQERSLEIKLLKYLIDYETPRVFADKRDAYLYKETYPSKLLKHSDCTFKWDQIILKNGHEEIALMLCNPLYTNLCPQNERETWPAYSNLDLMQIASTPQSTGKNQLPRSGEAAFLHGMECEQLGIKDIILSYSSMLVDLCRIILRLVYFD